MPKRKGDASRPLSGPSPAQTAGRPLRQAGAGGGVTDWRAVDCRALADAGQALQGRARLADCARLFEDLPLEANAPAGQPPAADTPVEWQVSAYWQDSPLPGERQLWLQLGVRTAVPLVCQRCLEVYRQPLQVDRPFRFVADEAQAEAEDDDCDEDLLVMAPKLDLLDLVEDELLLALPMIPMHQTCPQPPAALANAAAAGPAAADDGQRPHPFAALAGWKPGRPH